MNTCSEFCPDTLIIKVRELKSVVVLFDVDLTFKFIFFKSSLTTTELVFEISIKRTKVFFTSTLDS